jgi:hypothetical protein
MDRNARGDAPRRITARKGTRREGRGEGEFDCIDWFEARSDAEANSYAEREYADLEWYVLRAETGEVL